MIKTAIENLAEPIGFDIAHSDDIVQANLFNGLGRGFATYDERSLNMQLCYIEQRLNPQSRRLLKDLVEFIKLRENDK